MFKFAMFECSAKSLLTFEIQQRGPDSARTHVCVLDPAVIPGLLQEGGDLSEGCT